MKQKLWAFKLFAVFLLMLSASSWGQTVLISQYIETNSGSTPKGIEIYNPTATDLVFSSSNALTIHQGTNGGSCAGPALVTINSGTLNAGEVWVIGTSDLVSYASLNGTHLSGSTEYVFTFNGDDALDIFLGGTKVDVFGTCGVDPGSAWSGNGVSTANQNIQIKNNFNSGTTVYWSDPSVRFENVAIGTDMTGFGNAPVAASSPVIFSSVNSLSGFTYVVGSGPSTEQSFTVEGSNLTDNILVTPPADYEISFISGSGFVSTPIALNHTSGTVATTTVYTRLAAGLTVGNYSGDIVLSSAGAADITVNVAGSVTAIPVAPVVSPSSQTGNVGSYLTYQIQATENPASFAVTSGTLPAGLTLNVTTGVIDGTPTTVGFYSVEVTATNGVGTSAPATITFDISPAPPINHLVISQVYGGGGNSGATYTHDFVEIYNPTNTAIDVNGYSVQYTSASGSNWAAASLAGIIQPGKYYLVQLATGGSNGIALPAPDATGSMNMGANNGKVALVNGTTALTGACPAAANYVDLVGFGSANCAEGSTASAGSNTESLIRVNNQDTDNNSVDFSLEAPNPRNSTFGAITWDGTSWSNTTGPDAASDAVIAGNYTGSSFEANSLTINSGNTLTLNSGTNLTTNGNVINNGDIVVADGGNFIQTSTSTYDAASAGTFTVNKTASTPANLYTFWSSPVVGQDMYSVFPNHTVNSVVEYLTLSDSYGTVAAPAVSVSGKGYGVRVPAANAPVSFVGIPNNGLQTLGLINTVSTNGNTWNLIGNPYPSNLSLTALYNTNSSAVGSTFYLYNLNASDRWGTFNAVSSTWARANAALTSSTASVEPGQAFIAEATGTSISFDNSMRNADPSVFVNKSTAAGEGKFWLELRTSGLAVSGAAITYGFGGLDTFDPADSKVMSVGNNSLFSLQGTAKLAIQGKSAFSDTDIIALGNRQLNDAPYTIALAATEGLFANGQAIYLHDKQLGIFTNLQLGGYSFQASAGEQLNRFEILYQPQAALGVAETAGNHFTVYRDGEAFVIKSTEKIIAVTVYDSAGRLIRTLKPNAKEAAYYPVSKGVYILKIKSESKETTAKILK